MTKLLSFNDIKEKPIIFTAQSKRYFYCKDAICQFVFDKGAIPLNPFRVFEYFLGDRVERNLVRTANFNLILASRELWVFGQDISDGVFREVLWARQHGKTIRYFTIENQANLIKEVETTQLYFEDELRKATKLKNDKLLALMLGYAPENDPARQLPLFQSEVAHEAD